MLFFLKFYMYILFHNTLCSNKDYYYYARSGEGSCPLARFVDGCACLVPVPSSLRSRPLLPSHNSVVFVYVLGV